MIKKKKRNTNIHIKLHQVCITDTKCRRIPHSPNSMNTMHWAEKANWKKAWEEEVYYSWLEVSGQYKELSDLLPYKRSKCEIFVFACKAQDDDNRVASMKGIVDGMKKAGLIFDDDPTHFRLKVTPVNVTTREAEHIEIHLKLSQ